MAAIERVVAILKEAEDDLLELLALAAKRADYPGIDAAREAAARVRQLRDRLGQEERPDDAASDSIRRGSHRMKSTAGSKAKGGYPKFVVEDSTLVKIGWSKKKRGEYTQRIPGDVFFQVVEALQAVGGGERNAIRSELIHEWLENRHGGVPSYQTYGVIRFLRDRGVVRQVGRGEYAVPSDVAQNAGVAWGGGGVEDDIG